MYTKVKEEKEENSKGRGWGKSDFLVGWDIFFSFFDFRVLGRGEGWIEMEISMEGGRGLIFEWSGAFFLG